MPGQKLTDRNQIPSVTQSDLIHIVQNGTSFRGTVEQIKQSFSNEFAGLLQGTSAPSNTPNRVGLFFIDTVAKEIYVSTGTGSVNDWTLITGESTPNPIPPENTLAPAITGTVEIGAELTVSTGTWTGTEPITYSYEWLRDGVVIDGATSATYTLALADASSAISARVTATNAAGSATVTSGAVNVPAAPTGPISTLAPAISGTAALGETLTTTDGTWTGTGTISYAYQWQRDGANIAGATASTYDLVEADLGTSITCDITATDDNGSATASSNAIAVPAIALSSLSLTADPGAINTTVTTNTAGVALYVVVVANNATAPSAAQIAEGNNASDAPAIAAGSIVAGSVTAGANSFAQLTGLDVAEYDVYVAQGTATVTGGVNVTEAAPAFAITSIDATGWTATYPDPDPVITPEVITVQSPGFNELGVATMNEREVIATHRRRQPGSDDPTPDTVVLSHWVYPGDVITGVTNNSTRAVPLPQMLWTNTEWERVEGDMLKCSLFVFHEHGTMGKSVACVEFTVSDGTTTTAPIRVTDMTLNTSARSGVPFAEYVAMVDVSGLADGELTRNAVVKPWVGEAFDISSDGRAWPSMDWITVSKAWKGSITNFAYVDNTATPGTGAVASDLATAKLTPFPTTLTAATALRNAHTTLSTNEMVLKEDQIHVLENMSSLGIDNIPFRIIGEDTGGAKPIIQRPSSNRFIGQRIYWQNVMWQSTPTVVSFIRSSATDASQYHIWVNCDFDIGGESTNPYFNNLGAGFMYDCNSNLPNGGTGTERNNFVALRTVGCTGWCNRLVMGAIGFDNTNTTGEFKLRSQEANNFTPHVGPVFAYGKLRGEGGTSNFDQDAYFPDIEGYCIAMVEGEMNGAASSNCMEFHGTSPNDIDDPRNYESGSVYACTLAGGDCNGPRDAHAGQTNPGQIYWRLQIGSTIWRTREIPSDGDTRNGFTQDASRTRNHPNRNRTAETDNIIYSSNFPINYGYVQRSGDFVGINTVGFVAGTNPIPFVDDRSITGSNTVGGGGDYRIIDDSETENKIANVPRVPSKRIKLPFDLEGNPVPLDGTALAGSYVIPQ